MRISPARLAALSFAALAFAACGGAPAAPTLPPLPSISLPSIALPSIGIPSFQADQTLESMFPDTIGGNAITPTSAQGAGVAALFSSTTDAAELNAFVSELGATVEQTSAALSFNLWPGATENEFTGITIGALRVQGVESSRIVAGLAELVREDVSNAVIGTQTIGGKTVTAVTNPEDAEENLYLYGVGDVAFFLGGTPAHVEEALTQLP